MAILTLGKLPLANALLKEKDLAGEEKKYPLELVFCPECSLLQITETVDPQLLFGEYLYFSSFSETMLKHAEALTDKLIERQRLSEHNLVVEVASNDGYLLQYFKKKKIPVLGIEPARNIARAAEEKGIPTVCKFFNTGTADELVKENKKADVIIGNNVLAHVANLNDFVESVRILLNKNGVAVFEFPYVKDMIENTEFDTIYHEHLCYYSLTAIKNLFGRHDLAITDVERIPIHGGSLRIYSQHAQTYPPKDSVIALLEEEETLSMSEGAFYDSFANKVLQLKKEMTELLERLKAQNAQIVGYGAAAKGSTLLNYFGIGRDHIDYVVDQSPYKQGRYMSGNHLPIVPPDRIKQTQPDYVLILPWNLKNEIIEQMSLIRQWNGKFIIPIPKVAIV